MRRSRTLKRSASIVEAADDTDKSEEESEKSSRASAAPKSLKRGRVADREVVDVAGVGAGAGCSSGPSTDGEAVVAGASQSIKGTYVLCWVS